MKESQENVNEEIESTEELENGQSTELLDFIDLVNCIVYYYSSASENAEVLDDADEWKRNSGYSKPKAPVIPIEVDDLVKKAFMKKLSDHI